MKQDENEQNCKKGRADRGRETKWEIPNKTGNPNLAEIL